MSTFLAGFLVTFATGLIGASEPPARNETAADWVTLRDGKVVRGEITESSAGTSLYVRRAWVRENLPDWAERWEAAESRTARTAQSKRKERLAVWRRERKPPADNAKDPILIWIDAELARLKDENAWKSSGLMLVKLGRNDAKSVTRVPRERSRWLRLAWTSELSNPEAAEVNDLKRSLEGRGFDLSQNTPVPIDSLRAPREEPDSRWNLRRAATELSVDPGLRFLRYQGLLLPEPKAGEPLGTVDPSEAIGALRQLLGENAADPLPAKLRELAARGRNGALVTRLDMAPDFSSVTVEIGLWVRQAGDQWVAAGSRSSRVRPDDLAIDAGKELAADPQVSTAFQVVEALGLGNLSPELKQRSLKTGAATRKALGEARSAAEADLAGLVLPVLSGPADSR